MCIRLNNRLANLYNLFHTYKLHTCVHMHTLHVIYRHVQASADAAVLRGGAGVHSTHSRPHTAGILNLALLLP